MTITAFPSNYSSVHGDMVFVVHDDHADDPVTYPNYKYVADVYVGATLVARVKKVPDPTYNYGIFNIGQIVRNYITTILNPDGSDFLSQKLADGEFTAQVSIQFGEEYSYTTYTNILEFDVRPYFNHYNTRPASVSNLEDFIDKPLTNRPYATKIRCDSVYNFIPFLPSTTDEFSIIITTYDASNNIIATQTLPYTPDSVLQLFIFNMSKEGLEDVGFVMDDVKYFTAEFPDTTTYRFDIDCECMYDVVTLHFLNQWGGFESKDFPKVSRNTISIEKKDFGKLPYTVNEDGEVSYRNNRVYNESRSVYSSQFKEKMMLNSDLLTDAEYRWLQELAVSPMIYFEDEDKRLYPVVISETNYELKKNVNDQLTNLTINIEFGEQLAAQYR